MSAEWHIEHDQAFEAAEEEAKKHFNRCAVCKRYACEYCFDDKEGVCREHSSTMSSKSTGVSGSPFSSPSSPSSLSSTPSSTLYHSSCSAPLSNTVTETANPAVTATTTTATTIGPGTSGPNTSGQTPQVVKVECPQCHATVPLTKFCEECEAQFGLLCPKCGNHVDVGVKFCGQCGTKMII